MNEFLMVWRSQRHSTAFILEQYRAVWTPPLRKVQSILLIRSSTW